MPNNSEVAQGSGPVLRAVVSSQRMFLEQKQLWPAYKLARKCSCSGLHAQAANIYASIQGVAPLHEHPTTFCVVDFVYFTGFPKIHLGSIPSL